MVLRQISVGWPFLKVWSLGGVGYVWGFGSRTVGLVGWFANRGVGLFPKCCSNLGGATTIPPNL